MSIVSLKFRSMRNHHDEYFQETNLRNLDGDKDVTDIMYNMLIDPQVHKDNDDHIHEDIEV